MKLKKSLCVFLSLFTAFAFTACKDDEGGSSANGGKETVTLDEEYRAADGLHKIKVTQTQNAFVQNGRTDYVLVYDETQTGAQECMEIVNKYVYQCTGYLFAPRKASEVTYNPSAKMIVVGSREKLFKDAGLEMPPDDLKDNGYYIKSKDNSVFLQANSLIGYRKVALSFLTHVLGYDMFSEDLVIFEKDGSTMPTLEIIEAPDFDYQRSGVSCTTEEIVGMGFTQNKEMFTSVYGVDHHTTMKLLPPSTYKEHTDWYADGNKQLCYYAHGNQASYEAMLDTAAERAIECLEKSKNSKAISITVSDSEGGSMNLCYCDVCKQMAKKYNYVSGIIFFCNALSAKIDEYYETQAQETGDEAREVTVLFFAYGAELETPPVEMTGQGEPIEDENGEYVPLQIPVDENGAYTPYPWQETTDDAPTRKIALAKNVAVYIAPIHSADNKTYLEEENKDKYQRLKGWSAVAENQIYMWLYETNFMQYFYPHNTFSAMPTNLRFCKDLGTTFMFAQSQGSAMANPTAFHDLKRYFNSKAYNDVNVNYNAVCDKYFKYAFGNAGGIMRKFYDELVAHMTYVESVYPNLNGDLYQTINLGEYWPQQLLQRWVTYTDQAFALIEKQKTSDPALYEAYYKNILTESMFPRYALLDLYSVRYSTNTRNKMRETLKSDCTTLSLKCFAESKALDNAPIWG